MSSTVKKGLGKGFGALLSDDFETDILSRADERINKLAIEDIFPSQDQPRKHFDETSLGELAKSIKRYGILQPLVVTKKDHKYQIIAGERRYRAAKIAGLTHVPAIVRSNQELERLEIALVENVQRVDLSPLEQALSIERLHQQFSKSYGEIAERLGKAPTTVNNIVRLLQLPDKAKEALKNNEITEGHARAILSLKEYPEKQQALLNHIKKDNWSVRQAEQFVVATKKGAPETKAKKSVHEFNPQTVELSKHLNTPVTIKRTAKGGRIEIHFKDDQGFNDLVTRLKQS